MWVNTMIRWNIFLRKHMGPMSKVLVVSIFLNVFLIWNSLNQLQEEAIKDTSVKTLNGANNMATSTLIKPCVIDKNRTIGCLQYKNEAFLPFSFIQDQLDVYGQFSENQSVFEYESSKGVIHPKIIKYNATGSHADDLHYFVEGRYLIKYIDGIQGVPVTRQWFEEGFFFSTSIAQFGLSHYSKYAIQPPPKTLHVIQNGVVKIENKISGESCELNTVTDPTAPESGRVVHFKTPAEDLKSVINLTFTKGQIQVIQKKPALTSLIMYGKIEENSSLSVQIYRQIDDTAYHIHYVVNNSKYTVNKNTVVIGIGARTIWSRITRNVYVDLEKALRMRDNEPNKRVSDSMPTPFVLQSISLRGAGQISSMFLASDAHLDHFYNAANWLLANQDRNGGWPMPVDHTLGTYTLKPGWYTALGQGLGMSMLCRAYHVTKNPSYLNGCLRATDVFHKSSADGGVRAIFLDKYVWYEEYPTQPPSFVLNGFITALFGLYDAAQIVPPPENRDAQKLFDDGMVSLKALLPLYDSGTRTMYDLRHLTMHTDPNVCRWDYHNLHVELLQYLATIDNDKMFQIFADRWTKYKFGWRSAHN